LAIVFAQREGRGAVGSQQTKTDARIVITREALRDGSLLAAIRARANAIGQPLRGDAELDATLDAILHHHEPGRDILLFGYGSLMWNPAFHFVEEHVGQVRGWHRRFCLRMLAGRGTEERPGLMLALDRGGACRGVVFRIAAAAARTELSLVWRREMLSGAYLARWIHVLTPAGHARAVTFVVNRTHPRYAGMLNDDEVAAIIATARGELGSCQTYLDETRGKLLSFGIKDAALERIAAALERANAADSQIASIKPPPHT
jgi:cation transport protein ChaC